VFIGTGGEGGLLVGFFFGDGAGFKNKTVQRRKMQAHSMCRNLQKARLFKKQRTAHGVCLLLFERYWV